MPLHSHSNIATTPTNPLQVAALHCVAGFIQQLEEAKERDAFQPMISPMLATLGRCLTVRGRPGVLGVRVGRGV